jgi:hypothetical protein
MTGRGNDRPRNGWRDGSAESTIDALHRRGNVTEAMLFAFDLGGRTALPSPIPAGSVQFLTETGWSLFHVRPGFRGPRRRPVRVLRPVLSSMSCLIPNTAIESISTRPTSAGHTGDDGTGHSVVPKPGDGSSSSPPLRRAHGDWSFFGLTLQPTWNRSLLASVLVTITEGHHL